MARQEFFSPGAAFVEGQRARQQFDAGETRNRLAELELADAPNQIAQRNRLAALQNEGTEMGIGVEKAKIAHAQLQQALDSGNPKQFIMQNIPLFASKLKESGVDIANLDDESVKNMTANLVRKYAGEAGVAPAAPIESQEVGGVNVLTQGGKYLNTLAGPKGAESYTLGPGQTRYGPDGKVVASVPAAPREPREERLVQIADPNGNPQWVRESDAVGKAAYVARDKPAAADIKYQRELKAKTPRLKAAIRRLERVKQAVDEISKGTVTDGGELDQFVINRTKAGKELIAASAQLLPELTALTRVPGIGSQSDLETRLANLQFPSSEFPPEVNRKNAAELEAFLQDLAAAYEIETESAPKTASSAPKKISSDEEYDALPSGSVFIAPDGSQRKKP